MKPVYSVIIPAYNEEEGIAEAYRRLTCVMRDMGEPYELIFVNDGSRDGTAAIIAECCAKDASVRLVNFTRNFGHMQAISAGMEYARGAAVFVIDADLQDPPEVLPLMAAKWKEGYHVVYGQRLQRKGETWFKKATSKLFYRVLRRMTTVDLPLDTGEFRLIDRKVCDAVNRLPEKNRYVRGLVSWVGFKQTAVEYVRQERFAGQTKYSLRKMFAFATDAIISFSYKPLKLATALGFFISLLSFAYMIFIFYQRLFTDQTIDGWASTVVIILFSQGIVLVVLGMMGEYIGRIYEEIKGRPLYVVQEVVEQEKSS
ncbi:MAG: glycosyltransferase family 2 protein [Treponema sp.]|nr:glycosyltransferase family 2 protein [Treponema sp.]